MTRRTQTFAQYQLIAVLAIIVSAAPTLAQGLIPLDPRATHLRTRNDPAPKFQPRADFIYVDADQMARHVDSAIIDLATALPDETLTEGDFVLLEAVGEYCFHNPTCHLLGTGMWGIFSRDGVLLPDSDKDTVNRVPSSVPLAQASGAAEVVTVPDETWPTDIPNDFAIAAAQSSEPTVVQIPAEATHLLISAPDVQWFDNFIRPGGQYALRITKYGESSATGEFTGDGLLGLEDVEALQAEMRAGTNQIRFDVNYDGLVNSTDLAIWSNDLARTYAGDANLDGQFNSSDLTAVFIAGEYEDALVGNSTWSTGDWTGDGEFDSSDLVLALTEGGFEQGPRAGLAAVPEPATHAHHLLWAISLLLGGLRRNRG